MDTSKPICKIMGHQGEQQTLSKSEGKERVPKHLADMAGQEARDQVEQESRDQLKAANSGQVAPGRASDDVKSQQAESTNSCTEVNVAIQGDAKASLPKSQREESDRPSQGGVEEAMHRRNDVCSQTLHLDDQTKSNEIIPGVPEESKKGERPLDDSNAGNATKKEDLLSTKGLVSGMERNIVMGENAVPKDDPSTGNGRITASDHDGATDTERDTTTDTPQTVKDTTTTNYTTVGNIAPRKGVSGTEVTMEDIPVNKGDTGTSKDTTMEGASLIEGTVSNPQVQEEDCTIHEEKEAAKQRQQQLKNESESSGAKAADSGQVAPGRTSDDVKSQQAESTNSCTEVKAIQGDAKASLPKSQREESDRPSQGGVEEAMHRRNDVCSQTLHLDDQTKSNEIIPGVPEESKKGERPLDDSNAGNATKKEDLLPTKGLVSGMERNIVMGENAVPKDDPSTGNGRITASDHDGDTDTERDTTTDIPQTVKDTTTTNYTTVGNIAPRKGVSGTEVTMEDIPVNKGDTGTSKDTTMEGASLIEGTVSNPQVQEEDCTIHEEKEAAKQRQQQLKNESESSGAKAADSGQVAPGRTSDDVKSQQAESTNSCTEVNVAIQGDAKASLPKSQREESDRPSQGGVEEAMHRRNDVCSQTLHLDDQTKSNEIIPGVPEESKKGERPLDDSNAGNATKKEDLLSTKGLVSGMERNIVMGENAVPKDDPSTGNDRITASDLAGDTDTKRDTTDMAPTVKDTTTKIYTTVGNIAPRKGVSGTEVTMAVCNGKGLNETNETGQEKGDSHSYQLLSREQRGKAANHQKNSDVDTSCDRCADPSDLLRVNAVSSTLTPIDNSKAVIELASDSGAAYNEVLLALQTLQRNIKPGKELTTMLESLQDHIAAVMEDGASLKGSSVSRKKNTEQYQIDVALLKRTEASQPSGPTFENVESYNPENQTVNPRQSPAASKERDKHVNHNTFSDPRYHVEKDNGRETQVDVDHQLSDNHSSNKTALFNMPNVERSFKT